jgi:hypothetical protein
VPVTIGGVTTTRVDGAFRLAYLVGNAIMNVTTQDEQVGAFTNTAAHLEPVGCFVVEVASPSRTGARRASWAASAKVV